ncbi:MAG TPA: metallophosphoesterase [Phycisphaerales bacterium]|nr:metallophosphoesterase [Phycisphaerales bacterium]
MNHNTLVQPMFDGPVDLIADVHGEIDSLRDLLLHLGYDEAGNHRTGRRLVFLGDLVDRGPDSCGVIDLVMRLIDRGRAQCILGNHELNLLRGKTDPHNAWFRGEPWIVKGVEIEQVLLPQNRCSEVLDFIRTLPVALERPDLRAVHACWNDEAIENMRHENDALEVFKAAHCRINEQLRVSGYDDEATRELASQNENPIRVITSGPECRAETPFEAGGKLRHNARLPWWEGYDADAFCVCGHYWRTPLDGKLMGDSLFVPYDEYDLLGNGRVMCIDYSVGGRYLQRQSGHRPFAGRLAALRWPECELVFDDGEAVAPRARQAGFVCP